MISYNIKQDIFKQKCWCHSFFSVAMLHGSGSVKAASGQQERSGRGETRVSPGKCPLAALTFSSAGESSLFGLIKPTDPLLLIDFLIINSVCPSISLRRQISPGRAEVLLCYLWASGYRRANIDHVDEKPHGEIVLCKLLCYRLHYAHIKTQFAY